MIAMTADDARRFLAEEIRVAANISSSRVVDALATIPRERYLPPGPWQFRGAADVGGAARQTEDADPSRVYHDVAIAIDPARNLYNGQPSLIARWLDLLDLQPGQRVVHIGCGTGYFTALIAHVVGPHGRVDAMEVDAELAAWAARNVSDQPWVDVAHGNGSRGLPADTDRMLVHAGATHVLDAWLDALTDGGRLLVPLTTEFPGMPGGIGKGVALLVTRSGSEWRASAAGMMPVAIYSLKEIRDEAAGGAVGRALASGALMRAARVRRDAHEQTATCVVHAPSSCVST